MNNAEFDATEDHVASWRHALRHSERSFFSVSWM